MDDVQGLIIFLQVIIGVGAAARVTYCMIKKAMDDEGKDGYKKLIKNTLVFAVAAELVTSGINLIQSYF